MPKDIARECKLLRKQMRSVRKRLKRHTIQEEEKAELREELASLKKRYLDICDCKQQ